MMRLENGGMPHLVVLAPDSDRDRRVPRLRTSPPAGHQRADPDSGNPTGLQRGQH
jgi:hypothetical protein